MAFAVVDRDEVRLNEKSGKTNRLALEILFDEA